MNTPSIPRGGHRSPLMRLLALCLFLSFIWSLAGCTQKPEDSFLIARAEELLPKTVCINRLFYEEGIPVEEGATPENGYLPADMLAFRSRGFETLQDVHQYVREVWTADFAERFQNSYLFAAVSNGNMIVDSAYCYDRYEKDETGEETYLGIMVLHSGLSIRTSAVEYHYDTLRVMEKTKRRATLEITVTVKEGEKTQTKPLEVVLSLEDDGVWRLDSYTCCRFFEEPVL